MLQTEPQRLEQRVDNRPKRWTNHVLIQSQPHKITYYLPCYLRMKLKSIQSVNITQMQGQISCVMIFTTHYGPLSRHLIDYLKTSTILQYNRNDSIKLSSQNNNVTINQNYKQKTLNFTIRNTLTTQIEGDLKLSPFQLLKMKLIVSIRSIIIQKEELQDERDVVMKFNFMDYHNSTIKLSYGENVTWQSYSLAPAHTYVSYTNHIIPQNQLIQPSYYPQNRTDPYIDYYPQLVRKDSKQRTRCKHELKHFQYANFYIGIYRFPMASVATVYVPMWSMAFYNLFVYFQNLNDLAMKLNNGLVILLTLFVYLPTIRSQIPDKTYLTVSQILLLVICLTFIINMISGVFFYQQSLSTDPNELQYYYADVWFYVSMVLVLLTFVAVVVISVVHKLKWQPSYLNHSYNTVLQAFNYRKWGNKHADNYFSSQKFNCIEIYT